MLAVRPGAGQGVLTGLLTSYAELPGSGPVEVLYCYDEVSALRTGAADVTLMCATSTTNGLELLVLGDERPVAMLPEGHHLAARPSLAMADLHSLPEFSDALPNEPLDAIVDRVARGLLVVVVGEGVADRLGATVTAVPVVDYPVTHLVLAWATGQASAPRGELVRMAQGLTLQDRLAPVVLRQDHHEDQVGAEWVPVGRDPDALVAE
jgi:hypothetical protein